MRVELHEGVDDEGMRERQREDVKVSRHAVASARSVTESNGCLIHTYEGVGDEDKAQEAASCSSKAYLANTRYTAGVRITQRDLRVREPSKRPSCFQFIVAANRSLRVVVVVVVVFRTRSSQ